MLEYNTRASCCINTRKKHRHFAASSFCSSFFDSTFNAQTRFRPAIDTVCLQILIENKTHSVWITQEGIAISDREFEDVAFHVTCVGDVNRISLVYIVIKEAVYIIESFIVISTNKFWCYLSNKCLLKKR